MSKAKDINLNILRADDVVTFRDGTSHVVQEAWNTGKIYQFRVEDELIVSYDIHGKSIEHPELDIVDIELTEKPEDKQTFFFPKIDVKPLPVLTVNGEDIIIKVLNELDGLEIKEPQTLKASYKPCIIAQLFKKHAREITLLKQEIIICQSDEECEEKLKTIEKQFVDVSDEEAKAAGDNLVIKLAKGE